VCVYAFVDDAERDQAAAAAGSSATLTPYSFDNIGGPGPSAALGGYASSEANSGRYIEDDLANAPVMFPDGTALPVSSFAGGDGSIFMAPGMVDSESSLTGVVNHDQAPQATAANSARIIDSVIFQQWMGSDSDSANLGVTVSGTMTSEELSQYLHSGSVLTEMQSDEFLRQFEAGTFLPMMNDSVAMSSQPSQQ